jgi:fumarate hydratase subunit beta
MQKQSSSRKGVRLIKKISTPLPKEVAQELRAGDQVELSGVVYGARDAAHQRLMVLLDEGAPLPFEITNSVIYYVGPCPARPGEVTGSAGPTTSGRMDSYTPRLLDLGLRGMIGKGRRSPAVIEAMIRNKAVYFGAIGGAGALIASCIKSSRIIAFSELGPEAIRELVVENFPLTVVIDSQGNNLYESEQAKYRG